MSRIERILDLSKYQGPDETFGLVAAYCNCLTPREACSLLLIGAEIRGVLRDSVLRKICHDIDRRICPVHDQLLKTLLDGLLIADEKGRQHIGYCLSQLALHVPTKGRQKIQRAFLQSEYIGVRRRGYKSLSQEEKVPHNVVQDAWIRFHDPDCAWLMVKTAPPTYLIEQRASLVAALSEGWQFSRLYLRIGQIDKSLLKELRTLDQISYCYVLAKLGLRLSTSDAKGFVASNSKDERFGLLVWSLGKLGLWDVLEHIQTQLPAIQE